MEENVNSGENPRLGQEDFQEQEDDPDFVPSPPCSQRNSVESSKSVMICGRRYQTQKERINKMIADLEADPERFHSEKLENQATLLSNMLKDLNINKIIGLADTEPDFLEIFGETEDQVSDWSITTKYRIQDLLIRAYNEVADRKASTQSGFKKLSYPSFNGDVLCYQEFKRRWHIEVVPERRPPALELAALRESVSAIAKAKIIASTSMGKAWKLLYLDYRTL